MSCWVKVWVTGSLLAAAVGRRDVFESLGYGEASDTWSANPLSSAAVLATLDEFESTDTLTQGLHLAGIIEAGLVRLKETEVISKVRGEGCVWGIECADLNGHSGARSCQPGNRKMLPGSGWSIGYSSAGSPSRQGLTY